jgi:hypothetical protein
MSPETLLFSLPAGEDFLRGSFIDADDSAGIVVLARAKAWPGGTEDGAEDLFAGAFRRAGASILSVGLLTSHEENFSDIRDNVPLLAKRLLDFLDHMKRLGIVAARRRIGIYAEDAVSPAALRVAAERDGDIAALVCRGGLIDRAGTLYLTALNSRLLFIADSGEDAFLASAKRAFSRIGCAKETALFDASALGADAVAADKAANWIFAAFSSSD